jgi:hypothetical protein
VSAGVLILNGKKYIVVVGEHPKKDKKNGVTMIYDISAQVCSSELVTVQLALACGRCSVREEHDGKASVSADKVLDTCI